MGPQYSNIRLRRIVFVGVVFVLPCIHFLRSSLYLESLSTTITNGNKLNLSRRNVSSSEDRAGDTTIKVLIARTVSLAEVDNVLADVARIISYSHSPHSAAKCLRESLSQCNDLRKTIRPPNNIDPYTNGSDTFPNHILCDENIIQGNNYLSVNVGFLLFGLNRNVTRQLLSGSSTKNIATTSDDHHQHQPFNENQINIVDVSDMPKKIWNWITHLTEERLSDYDYIWMVDGDILLRSLNWHAFWQQVKLIKPKIIQPAIIGTAPGMHASKHGILRHNGDSRTLAAETAIVELMMPLFEVETWLGYRNAITKLPPKPQDGKEELKQLQDHSDMLHNLQFGDDCFDLAWCHYARANLTGEQLWPPKNLGYNEGYPTFTSHDNSTHGEFKRRSCVVLYQTPVIHGNKMTLGRDRSFRTAGNKICKYFRENYHIHFAVKSVYEVFVAGITHY